VQPPWMPREKGPATHDPAGDTPPSPRRRRLE
jgi:hypothetical protein